IFFDPACSYCRQILPDVARLDPDPKDGRPMPLVVSTGAAAENRRLMEQHGVRVPVLLQERDEGAQLYRGTGTPMGYLIDEQCVTTSPLAVGGQTLLELANAPSQMAPTGGPVAPSRNGYSPGRFGSLASSRINRNGLPAGSVAPRFRLPKVD